MSKYPGRRISATPPSVSLSAASGVWTLEEVMQYRQAGTWPVGVAGGDPNFNQTVLLLHGDGNQGANNLYNPGPPRYLAFTDNSDNNFPITVNGDAYGDNFSPFMTEAGQWSNLFNGSNGYLSVASNAVFAPGTGNFTIECWVNFSAFNANNGFFQNTNSTSSATTDKFWFGYSGGALLLSTHNGGSAQASATWTPVVGTWYHVAAVRESGTIKLFINGVQQTVTGSTTFNGYSLGQAGISVGLVTTPFWFNGYISNLRYVVGQAVYTTSFTPSTTPLTDTSQGATAANVEFLTCQSNRFVDNSTGNSGSGFPITINGGVTVKPLNPFTTTYSSTNGSGYFDGTGDNLRAPSNSVFNLGSSSDFTVELWVYPLSFASSRGLWGTGGTSTGSFPGTITTSGGFEAWVYGESPKTPTIPVRLNSWSHLAVTRSGGTWRVFVNGALDYSFTPSVNNVTTSDLIIGNNYISGADLPFLGYISDFRWVKGRAVYTSAFTPPTAPLGVTSGGTNPPQGNETSLLALQYQGSVRNVGFIDSSPYDHVITRNPATGPNAPTQGTFSPFSAEPGKWGNFFDGANNTYLSIANTADLDQSGDFTQEVWYCRTADGFGSVDVIFLKNITNYLYISVTQSTGVVTVNQHNIGTIITGTTATAVGVWYHLAVTRSGSSVRLFVNGAQEGSTATYSTNTTGTAVSYIGGFPNAHTFSGYLSNLRVVAGRAVYTSNFTPSTTPLGATSGGTSPPQGSETKLLTCQHNRFVDATGKIVTASGNPRVTPFSPFAPSDKYSPSVNGGSGYFDGTGDYLSGIGATGFFNFLHNSSALFTVQAWVYLLATGSSYVIFDTTNNSGSSVGAVLNINSSNQIGLVITTGNAGQFVFTGNSTGAITPNAWNHIAVTYNQSLANTNAVFYINGVQSGTGNKTAVAPSSSNATYPLAVGGSATGANSFNGYIANLRIDNSVESIAVPTAPIGNVATSRLLLNFTNAGIFDQTGKNVLETVGNAQVDTSVKKFGTGSMKFDGSGDYLIGPATQELDMGTGDWTVEGWVYVVTRNSNYPLIIGNNNGSFTAGALAFTASNADSASYNDRFVLAAYDIGGLRLLVANTTNAFNTWYHFAIVRSGTSLTIYRDGTSVASTTISAALTFNWGKLGLRMGGGNWDGVNGTYNGYIDDLRITKGVARYPTEPFPTAPFPDL